MGVKTFEELRIWKSASDIAEEIYKETNNAFFAKYYSLKDQVRRSLISISSNIAEGFEQNSNREFRRFLLYAKGSAGEVRSQIYLARKFTYINENQYEDFRTKLIDLSKQIGSLITYLENYQKGKDNKEHQ